MKHFYFSTHQYYYLLSLLLFNFSFSQKIAWQNYYGGINDEYLTDVIPTGDNGFIVGGSSSSIKSGNKNSENIGDFDYWIWKMDEFGKMEWQKSFGGNKNDLLNNILLTRDGGYLLVGTSNSDVKYDLSDACFGEDDIWIIKLNAFGEIQWHKTFGGSKLEKNPKILATNEGGYILGCTSFSHESGNKASKNYGSADYWVIKLSDEGEIQWQKTYGSEYSDEFVGLEHTNDNGFLIFGNSNSNKNDIKTSDCLGEFDIWILSIDKFGNLLWQQTFGESGDDLIKSVIKTKGDNFLLAGNCVAESNVNKKQNTLTNLYKINNKGEILWEKKYADFDILTSLMETRDENIIIGGYSKLSYFNQPNYKKGKNEDFFMVKIDSSAEQVWEVKIENKNVDILSKVIELPDGNYILAGSSQRIDKIKSNSNQPIYLDNDFFIVKIIDENKDLYQPDTIMAYPNPTNAFTNLYIGFPVKDAHLTLVDINGRIIQSKRISNRMEPINLSSLPKGIYIANLTEGNQSGSVKIIKN